MTVLIDAARVAPANKARREVPANKALADMTVRELVAICADERIETGSKPRKADLVAAIEAARGA